MLRAIFTTGEVGSCPEEALPMVVWRDLQHQSLNNLLYSVHGNPAAGGA